MAAQSSRLSSTDPAFIGTNYALTAFTYGATVFTFVRAAGQVAAFPDLVAIGVVAGLALRWFGEPILAACFRLCCPCSPLSRFWHRLTGVLTSIPEGVVAPLKTVDPLSLGVSAGWMLGNCYKEYFFTNADFRTRKPSLFGV